MALGLLLVCPTVSRTAAALSPTLDLGAWCTGHGLDRSHGTPSTPMAPATGDACGYCVLLGHGPALGSSFAVSMQAPSPTAPVAALADLGVAPGRAPPLYLRGPPQLG